MKLYTKNDEYSFKGEQYEEELDFGACRRCFRVHCARDRRHDEHGDDRRQRMGGAQRRVRGNGHGGMAEVFLGFLSLPGFGI